MSQGDTGRRPVMIHNHTPCELTIYTYDENDSLKWLSNEHYKIPPASSIRVNANGLVYINLELVCVLDGEKRTLNAIGIRGRHYIVDLSHKGDLIASVWNRAPNRSPTTPPNFKKQVTETVTPSGDETLMCKICMEEPIKSLLLPCGHAVACDSCLKQLPSECPICRLKITEVKTIFWA